ncbi:MAG TPA: hypothetical protein VIL41_02835 [Coriobacteriia bacterium]
MASDPDTPTTPDLPAPLSHPPLDEMQFAHASERVAAEILDFYRINWLYEPKTFPLEWDGKGNVIVSFSPDFYLVDFDLYIELTTMSQKLVTKKNRKVRRLKELYPDVNIRIFYQKDFRRLLARFGIASTSVAHADGGGVVPAEDPEQE